MPLKNINVQLGGILVVSLVFLLALTVVGLASLQSSSMNEQMSNNLKEMTTAFYGAETAIKAGERYIEAASTLESLENEGFVYGAGRLPNPFIRVSWGKNNTKIVLLGQLQSPPRYMVEIVGEFSDNNNTKMNIVNYDGALGGDRVTVYRVVAQGTNAQENGSTVLESFYGKIF